MLTLWPRNSLVCQSEVVTLFDLNFGMFSGDKEIVTDKILKKLDEAPMQRQGPGGRVVTLEGDDYDVTAVKSRVIANVQEAVQNHETRVCVAYVAVG